MCMKDVYPRLITGFLLTTLFWVSFLFLPVVYSSLMLASVLVFIVLFELPQLFNTAREWFFVPLYPIAPFAMLIHLNMVSEYRFLLLMLFVMVTAHDMGSYIFGNLFGRRKICPTVSPGKTWEGFFGGFLTTCVTLFGILWFNRTMLAPRFMVYFSFTVCLLALTGDLFESWLKRRVQVKDSGDLLPGHGGFLDRFDGILFAVFLFYIFKNQLITMLANA